ncbi:FAD-dependent monooxygenase, partial [Actinophytocola sp.]|uniref:FAD-dependent monooxygenase n=1 Tax=Actinophytocola sp. TaxID=1872138 RepID=UPI0039C8597B
MRAGEGFPAGEIIDATEHVFSGSNTYDFPTVPVWHRGRMIIIGDAAHATSPASGQGASMALEDAVTLAKCLRDLPAAYTAYENLRRKRVERVVAQGKRNGDGKAWTGSAGCSCRSCSSSWPGTAAGRAGPTATASSGTSGSASEGPEGIGVVGGG